VQDAAAGIIEIGQPVIDRGKDRPQPRFFSQIKRRLIANIMYAPRIDGVKISPEWVGQQFLRQLLHNLRSQQIFPSEIILTVPVDAYEKYLRWLEGCSSEVFSLDLPTAIDPKIRILDEPTAAALGYGAIAPHDLVLVIDLGGGTLDLSLVRLPQHHDVTQWGEQLGANQDQQGEYRAVAIAKSGYTVGGEDIDRWLMEDCLANYLDADLADKDKNHSQNPILKLLMERIKINLSETEAASTVFFDPVTQSAIEINYTRSQLETILERKGFYRILKIAINELSSLAFNKGILKGDIKHILLVGGCSIIPSVQALIADQFKMAQIHSHKPFEAIAHGALMLSQGVQVQDYLCHAYAIRYWERSSEQWKYQTIFRRGQVYPTRRPFELVLRASQPNQTEITLTIGELSARPHSMAEISFDGDRLVMEFDRAVSETFQPLKTDENGQVIAQAIAKLDPLGQPDCDRLKVLFSISEKRELLITVIDLLTSRYLLKNYPAAKLI
jgi:molecular chaperone DnaK (HSP70)